MSQLMENAYNIKELYVIKLKDNYKEYLPNLGSKDSKDVEYFNTNLYYIVEKFKIDNEKNRNTFYEFYTESIVGRCFFERLVEDNSNTTPEIFDEIYSFPKEYLTDREIKEGKIYTSRIFQIFQQINCNSLANNLKEKKLCLKKG